jgi:hypothetical protein
LIGPRVSSLASDLAALNEEMKRRGHNSDLTLIYQDLARIKEQIAFPPEATDYAADQFLDEVDSDHYDTLLLGYDAKVQEGCRFDWANEDVFEMALFSTNDPNAHVSNGLLLPAFDSVEKLAISTYYQELGIAQYGFQTITFVLRTVARERLRYGTWFMACTNAAWWATRDYIQHTLLIAGETYEWTDPFMWQGKEFTRLRKVWTDRWYETYWDPVVTEHEITGAHIAQSVLIPNDIWLTQFEFYLTSVASATSVYVTVCELTAGVPDHTKAILHHQVAGASLVTGWNKTTVQPTFLKGGTRYAIVLSSNANHKVGMAYGQEYVDGTFYYSTDGVYYLGDLTKDLMLRLYGAKFRAPQVVIEFTALNLDGGIQGIDILAQTVRPSSADLIYEVQPSGAGAWIPLDISDTTAWDDTPPLARFRGRFVGTRDMQVGLGLTGSEVTLFRPKTTFRHVSTMQTLAAPSTEIHVKVTLEEFDETPHDMTCHLHIGSPLTQLDPTLTTTTLQSLADKRYYREFKFEPSAAVTEFAIEMNGSTNSAANTFHVAERLYWSL